MSKSFKKSPFMGICCCHRGSVKAHRKQIRRAARAADRGLMAHEDFEALPVFAGTREDEYSRPDDGRQFFGGRPDLRKYLRK